MAFRQFEINSSFSLVIATLLLPVTILSGAQNVVAQTPAPVPPQPKQIRPAPKAAPLPSTAQTTPSSAPAAASGPVRTETITYEAWTVSCRDTADGKTKKLCSAALPMVVQQQNQRVNLGAWLIARNNEGSLLSVIQTPQIDIGVLIPKGVELKFGDGKPHKINYVNCSPQRCEATMPMDEATIKETIAAASGTATITFWKSDGADFSINIQSIKGIEEAIKAVR
jgi:invasion protein IalB